MTPDFLHVPSFQKTELKCPLITWFISAQSQYTFVWAERQKTMMEDCCYEEITMHLIGMLGATVWWWQRTF